MKLYSAIVRLVRRFDAGPALFLSVFCVSFLVLVYRAPSPLFFPDFYAEDGRDYLLLLPFSLRRFLAVAFLPHDGFYLLGNVVLAQMGIVVNAVVFHGDLADLPRSISLVSYSMFAALFGATAVVLRKRLSLLAVWFTSLWLCVLPMPRSPELVLGRISNCGLLAFYGGVLIVLQRTLYTNTRANAVACDVLFLICVYSNPVTLLLLPFLYARQLRDIFLKRQLSVSRAELYSAGIVIVCCVFYAAVCFKGKVLTPAGYMRVPFRWENGIEVMLARSMLFPLIYPIYQWMTDFVIFLVLVVVALALGREIRRRNGAEQWWYVVVVFGVVAFSVVALVFRPGFSQFVAGYDWARLSHPEYFYLQNYLATLLLGTVLYDLTRPVRWLRVIAGIICSIFMVGAVFFSQSSRVGVWNLYLGTFAQELELRYWERSHASHYYLWTREGQFLHVRTGPFDGAASHSWWPALLPKNLVEQSRVGDGEFQRFITQSSSRAGYHSGAK
jgi:hypothetical protein